MDKFARIFLVHNNNNDDDDPLYLSVNCIQIWDTLDRNQQVSIGRLVFGFLRRGENRSTEKKKSRRRVENNQSQLTCKIKSGNRTTAPATFTIVLWSLIFESMVKVIIPKQEGDIKIRGHSSCNLESLICCISCQISYSN